MKYRLFAWILVIHNKGFFVLKMYKVSDIGHLYFYLSSHIQLIMILAYI
jgi:hypothetical protein